MTSRRTSRTATAGETATLEVLPTLPPGERVLLAAVSIDVVIQAASDEVRAHLMRAIADAVLRDPDAEDADDYVKDDL